MPAESARTDHLTNAPSPSPLGGKGQSFSVDRYQRIAGHCLHLVVSEKTKVAKTKPAIKQGPCSGAMQPDSE